MLVFGYIDIRFFNFAGLCITFDVEHIFFYLQIIEGSLTTSNILTYDKNFLLGDGF